MKKLQPINALTKEDEFNIKSYIRLYSNCECGPLPVVLQEWNRSKRKLFHALGNQLMIKKKIQIPIDIRSMKKKLKEVYNFRYMDNYSVESFCQNRNKEFFDDFIFYLSKMNLVNHEIELITSLFSYSNIINGHIRNRHGFKLMNYSFSVQYGAKTMRTIQKCLKALHYPNMDLFNKWRSKINTVNSNNVTEANLVISIHPIDFMTMSDNSCNWSSCMSWTKGGSYNAGTIEMMNSNVAAVAYIESQNPYEITLDENQKLSLPNKSWRCLVYCNKHIILSGKSYPYRDTRFSQEIVRFMRETVEKTFGWTYKYEHEYKDIYHYSNNSFLKYDSDPNYNNKKKIIIYTNGMYNDLVEDSEFGYWCCRNPLKKGLRLCLSGKVTCMCCGEEIYLSQDSISEPDHIDQRKICNECLEHQCPVCKTYVYKSKNKYNVCSKACAKDALYFPGQDCVISKVDYLYSTEYMIIVRKDEHLCYKISSYLLKEKIELITEKKLIKILYEEFGYIEGRDYILKSINSFLYKHLYVPKMGQYYAGTTIKVFSYTLNREEKKLVWDKHVNAYMYKLSSNPIHISINNNIKQFLERIKTFEYYPFEGRV